MKIKNKQQTQYKDYKKPSWAPPAYLFGPVWTVLYILIFISFGFVFLGLALGLLLFSTTIPFFLNLFFNFIFTYIQFKLKNNFLASLDILAVLVTLVWAMVIIYPIIPWVTYILIPYLLWVTFATVLQLTITKLNK